MLRATRDTRTALEVRAQDYAVTRWGWKGWTDILGRRRTPELVRRREEMVAWLRDCQPCQPSFPDIARAMGRAHSTIIAIYYRQKDRAEKRPVKRTCQLPASRRLGA